MVSRPLPFELEEEGDFLEEKLDLEEDDSIPAEILALMDEIEREIKELEKDLGKPDDLDPPDLEGDLNLE